jgi:hypothetical protein
MTKDEQQLIDKTKQAEQDFWRKHYQQQKRKAKKIEKQVQKGGGK